MKCTIYIIYMSLLLIHTQTLVASEQKETSCCSSFCTFLKQLLYPKRKTSQYNYPLVSQELSANDQSLNDSPSIQDSKDKKTNYIPPPPLFSQENENILSPTSSTSSFLYIEPVD